MIRSAGPQERIVDEAKDLNLMNFKFKDNEKPISLVMCMAECLRVSVTNINHMTWTWNYKPCISDACFDEFIYYLLYTYL